MNALMRHIRISAGSLNLFLFCMAILLSLYDTVSTVMSVKAVGPTYEGNIIIREVIHHEGVLVFAGIKLGITVLVLLVTYYIIRHKADLGWGSVKTFYGIYVGTAISSFFVATSNLSVVYESSSFYLMGLNSLRIGLILLFIAPIIGILLDIKSFQKEPYKE